MISSKEKAELGAAIGAGALLVEAALAAAGVDLAAIEAGAFGGIGEQVVGGGDLLELLLLGAIARVHVGMELFRQPVIGLLDGVVGGVTVDAEDDIGVSHSQNPLTSLSCPATAPILTAAPGRGNPRLRKPGASVYGRAPGGTLEQHSLPPAFR